MVLFVELSFLVVDTVKDELQVWNLWNFWVEIREKTNVENM